MTYKYMDGEEVKFGDYVQMWGTIGTVVCIIDEDKFSNEYPKNVWSVLKKGILIDSKQMGFFHYKSIENEEDITLLKRGDLDLS